MKLLTRHHARAGTDCSSRASNLHLHLAIPAYRVRLANYCASSRNFRESVKNLRHNSLLARSSLSSEPGVQPVAGQLSSSAEPVHDRRQEQLQKQEVHGFIRAAVEDVQQGESAPAAAQLDSTTERGAEVNPIPGCSAQIAQTAAAPADHAHGIPQAVLPQGGDGPAADTLPAAATAEHALAPSSDATPLGISDAADKSSPAKSSPESAAAESTCANSSSSSNFVHPPGGFYSYYLVDLYDHPVPVQIPPQGAKSAPPAYQPAFSKSKYLSPKFLRQFPVPETEAYNYISFLGAPDWHGGKYYVRPNALEDFLEPYWQMAWLKKRRMHIAECYQDQPYKYFQELDFPWSLDVNLVLQLIPKLVQIVAEEASRAHHVAAPYPQPVVSMRTPYKVHLNFPEIFTVEAKARSVRKHIINRCRQELSGLLPLQRLKEEEQLHQQVLAAQQALQQLPAGLQETVMQQWCTREGRTAKLLLSQVQLRGANQTTATSLQDDAAPSAAKLTADPLAAAAAVAPQQQQQQQLDWESIIDSPHGSLRLLGSCKPPWMDSDPAWVTEKCYSRVEYVEGLWMRQPLSYASVKGCSILLNAMELRVFEQSQDFLEVAYQSVDSREQILAAKRLIRYCTRELKRLQKLQQQDGSYAEPTPATAAAAAAGQKELRQSRHQSNALKRKILKEDKQLVLQQQRAADELERQRKKEAALAKLKAAAASTTQQQQQLVGFKKPGLTRPGVITHLERSVGIAPIRPVQLHQQHLQQQQQQASGQNRVQPAADDNQQQQQQQQQAS